jgi:hypothetical protein
MAYNQQNGTRPLLLRRRCDWAVDPLVALVAQLPLTSQQYLHPRDVQWSLWPDLDVRKPLRGAELMRWHDGRRTLWRDNDCYHRHYRRVRRHLWVSSDGIFDPEVLRYTPSSSREFTIARRECRECVKR